MNSRGGRPNEPERKTIAGIRLVNNAVVVSDAHVHQAGVLPHATLGRPRDDVSQLRFPWDNVLAWLQDLAKTLACAD